MIKDGYYNKHSIYDIQIFCDMCGKEIKGFCFYISEISSSYFCELDDKEITYINRYHACSNECLDIIINKSLEINDRSIFDVKKTDKLTCIGLIKGGNYV